MIKRILSVAALSLLVAACGGGDDTDAADADSTTVQTVPGTDTITQPTVVPTTDSIVSTTDVDTIQGQVDADTMGADSAH